MDPLHYDEPWQHQPRRTTMPDPLTMMAAIIEAYKNWRANPTAEHWAVLDWSIRAADKYAREIEDKLHPK